MKRSTIPFGKLILSLMAMLSVGMVSHAAENVLPLKAGIIGLDAHALPWTQILNHPKAGGELAQMKITAAYPGGSKDIPQSMELLHQSVEPIRALGVEICSSIETVLSKVDVVLLLSIDGRIHLEQVKPVFAARKPVFIDKPVAGSLAEAIQPPTRVNVRVGR